jgi:hypothetical protein
MKKVVLFLSLIVLTLIVLTVTFSSMHNSYSWKGNHYIYVDVENGDKTEDILEIMFSDVLTDSLKITKQKLQEICENGVLYGDWNVKFRPTYKFDDGFIYFGEEEDEILFSIKGTCENGYGVRDEIMSIISFNRKGIMKNDEDGLPKIVSF